LGVDDIPFLGHGDEHPLRKHFLARYGPPAFVRRARDVQDALDQLVERCRRQREEWLDLVRTWLGVLHALAGEWSVLEPWLHDAGQVAVLHHLHAALQPRLRGPVKETRSRGKLAGALQELRDGLLRFNRRWQVFLPTVDLSRVNELRAGYNRYYVLEKECAFRSPILARQGFTRLEPLTTADLFALLPLLPVPRLASV
jgi:hypothetical protein